jgi:hypothetical protein
MGSSTLGMIHIRKDADDGSTKWESIELEEYRTKMMLEKLRFYKQECIKITEKIRVLSKKLEVKVDLTNFKIIE